MEVEVRIDCTRSGTKVLILTDEMTEEVKRVLEFLKEDPPSLLIGKKGDKMEILNPDDLIRIYASEGRVYGVTEGGEYVLRLRIYEAEDKLRGKDFVRVSNSEILNLKKIKSFDLNFARTICVEMSDGSTSYVSKRYVSRIKSMLGL